MEEDTLSEKEFLDEIEDEDTPVHTEAKDD